MQKLQDHSSKFVKITKQFPEACIENAKNRMGFLQQKKPLKPQRIKKSSKEKLNGKNKRGHLKTTCLLEIYTNRTAKAFFCQCHLSTYFKLLLWGKKLRSFAEPKKGLSKPKSKF